MAKTIETVRAEVKAARGLAVADTVNLDGTVNFANLREQHVSVAFPHVWVDGFYGKVNGAVIGCRDKRFYLPELENCVRDLKAMGFKVRKLPGDLQQYTVT